ncbi:MAG TPA: glycosyltransferase family 39 protein [Bryobacteraceae bacterium]|nr:glycosyltransferase family 39 protein [Bryobacteraceae bacterium]
MAAGTRFLEERRVRSSTYLYFFAAFMAVVCLTHARFVDLPYYWDEMGQFVPAALDILERGAWVPERTVPNVHPPGLMAYLAAVWSVFGHSIPVTRLAMLLLASAAVLVIFLLAIELTKGVRGAPAFAAVVLILASPLFYTQAMLAQLDMPAMLLACWALLLFLQSKWRAAAVVSVALTLVKETGVVVPAVLGLWLWFEGRKKEALWFALPLAALGGWLVFLWAATGNLFGNREFTDYNLFFPLHPVRLGAAVARRVFYLGFEHLHWLGWLFVFIAWRKGTFRTRAWRIAAVLGVAQVAVVTLFGGAVLERYLLPVLPLMYIAFAVAMPRVPQVLLAAALAVSLFWSPPYPTPLENNLAMVDFIRLQQTATKYVEKQYPNEAITTAWPMTAELWLPELGYVKRRMTIQRLPEFKPADIARLKPDSVSVFVLYSRDWDRPLDFRKMRLMRGIMRRMYRWEPQVTGEDVERRFGVSRVAFWERGGQWAAVYAKP